MKIFTDLYHTRIKQPFDLILSMIGASAVGWHLPDLFMYLRGLL